MTELILAAFLLGLAVGYVGAIALAKFFRWVW